MPALPGVPRLQAGPAPAPRRASGEDFGAGVGAAQQQRAGVFDQVAEASERILAAREGARASRALSEAQLELESFHDSLRDDPDESTHEERFEQAQKEIRERHGKGLFGAWAGDFDERFEGIVGRGRMRVRDDVRVRRIDATLADGESTLTNLERLAARAEGEEQAEVMAQAAAELGRLRGINAISEQAMQKRLQAFQENVADGWWKGGKNEDPEGTLADLKAREGPARHMDEARRQVAIEEVENEIKQRDRLAKAEAAESEARAKEARRQVEEDTARQGMGLVLDGSISVAWIKQNLPNLSRTEADYFLDQARRGGTGKSGIPDMAEWQRLVDLRYEDPERFAQEKIDPEKVGPAEWEKLKAAQAQARKGESSPPGDIRTVSKARVDLRPDLADTERAELQRSFEAALEDFEKEKGGKAGLQEQQSVLDAVELQRYRRDSWGWDGGARLMPAGTRILPELDPDLETEAVRELNREGKVVTPEAVDAKAREIVAR